MHRNFTKHHYESGRGFTMTTGVAATIEHPRAGAFSAEDLVVSPPLPFVAPSTPVDILASLRQEVGLRPPRVFSAVREATPQPSVALPSDAPLCDFARHVENQ